MVYLRYLLLAAGLATAIKTDIIVHKILNNLTAPMAVAGLGISFYWGMDGLLESIKGLAVGLIIGIVLWLAGVFRAGDAKLLAAIGSVMGNWLCLLDCLCWSVLCAGTVGVILLLIRGQLRARLKRLWDYLKQMVVFQTFHQYHPAEGSEGELPFAPFLALGTILSYCLPVWR